MTKNTYTYENELYHYGVLGMKWGIRKDPEKAYNRSAKKARKLVLKRDKLRMKGSKYSYKLQNAHSKLESKSTNNHNVKYRQSKVAKLQKKVNRLSKKEQKMDKKVAKWADAMEKQFGNISIDRIPQADIDQGKEYANYIWAIQSKKSAKENYDLANKYTNQFR